MYIEKKKIGKNTYNYLKASFRIKDKVRTKTIAYLGKAPMSKKQIQAKISKIPKSRIYMVKEDIANYGKDLNTEFLTKQQLQELENLKKDFIKKLKLDNKLVQDMFKDFETYYIYNTNAIEGNTLTLEQTNSLLNRNITPAGKDLREIYDHLNERTTFEFILNKKPEINKDTIIKIHSMLMDKIDNRTGNFRKHNVRVFGSELKPTPWQYIKADIKIILSWYNINKHKLHPLILSAIFHEKLERIHPFYDGNGRAGRMLSNIILIKNRYPPIIIENKKRKKYHQMLAIGHKADLRMTDIELYRPIVDFFYNQLTLTYKRILSKWG